jgi:hypothetical protein
MDDGNSMETEQALTEEQAAELRIHELAQKIRDEEHLRFILRQSKIGLRRQVYEQIVPHLKFSPRSYRKLMKHG